MHAKVIKNILSDDDINRLTDAINHELKTRPIVDQGTLLHGHDREDTVTRVLDFGRIDIKYPKIPQDIIDKVLLIVKENVDESYTDLAFDFVIYADYSKASGGNPRLRPHFDSAESTGVILDYQLKSNVSWEIKVESDLFDLEDNSGLLFNPLDNIHYRPVKVFSDDDFVRMLFFRFVSSKSFSPITPENQKRLDFIIIDHDKEQEEKVGIKNEI